MAGNFLPIQLIYHGKTSLSQHKYKFPNKFCVTQTPNHRANEETSIAFLEHDLIPYIETQREELNSGSPWLLIQMFSKVSGPTMLRKLSDDPTVRWSLFPITGPATINLLA